MVVDDAHQTSHRERESMDIVNCKRTGPQDNETKSGQGISQKLNSANLPTVQNERKLLQCKT